MRRSIFVLFPLLLASCAGVPVDQNPAVTVRDQERREMVLQQIQSRGITNPQIELAFNMVPREPFVAPTHRSFAYAPQPLPLPNSMTRTLRPAFETALILDRMKLKGREKVLEVGSGNGYRACLLGRLAGEVYATETDMELARQAEKNIRSYGNAAIRFRAGASTLTWSEQAPFDIILASVLPKDLQQLTDQLTDGGSLFVGPTEESPVIQRYFRVSPTTIEKEDIPLPFTDTLP